MARKLQHAERRSLRSRRSPLTPDTGDNLHFGLARLMAQSQGIPNVELVVVGDDVSVPRSRGKMVGRRCLAGITMGKSSPDSLAPEI